MGFLTAIGLAARGAGAWLLKNPAILLTAVMGAMFVMVVVSKNSEIHTLNTASDAKDKRIETLVTSLGQARANVATLNGTLATQSQSIADLRDQGVTAGQKFDTIIAGMSVANATTAKKLDMLDKAKPGADKCVSAQALVKGAVQ